ncbi:MAG: addiction module antidote protein [Pseudomonadota bacterium]
MKRYKTFNQIEESYFREHPEEIDDYINLIFDEFAKDGNLGALLASLRVLSRAKGISKIAQETSMSRKGIQKALSEDGNPKFSNVNAIVQAMGYRLTLQKINGRTQNQPGPSI